MSLRWGSSSNSGNSQKKIKKVGPFVLTKTLGRGARGPTKLALHKERKEYAAIKIISKDEIVTKPMLLQKLEREIAILRVLRHPNIIRLFDCYESKNHFFIVTEYIPSGTLSDFIQLKGKLEPLEALNIFQQLADALDLCHSNMICHRDLRSNNILLRKEGTIVILDWGTSRLVRKGGLLETRCGDAQFMAPEVVSGNKYSGFVADVWSAGVILYHLLTGTLPFADPSIHEVFNKVQLGIYTIPTEFSKGIQDLLSQMLCLDPRIRITAKEIKKHYWVNNGQATIRQYPEIEQRMNNTRPANEPEDEIVRFLTHLGWGSSSEVRSALSSPDTNMEKVYYGLVCENLKENLSNPFVISQTQQNLYSTLTHTKPDQAVSQLESLMGMLIRANSTPKRGDLRLSAVPSPNHSQQLVSLVASPSPKTVAQQALNKNLTVTTSPRPRSYSADISENTSISPSTSSGWSVSSSAGDLSPCTPPNGEIDRVREVVRSIKLPNPASRFVDIEYESERSDDSSSDVSTSPRGGRRSQRESMDLRDPEKEKEKEKEKEREKEREKEKEKEKSKDQKEEIPVTKIWQDVASTTPLSWIIDYEELEIQEVIGTGGFGEVYKGLWRGTEVAVKKMKSDEMTEEEVRCFMDEIQMMSKLRHPNIVLFLGACLNEPHICYVTEFVERGSLHSVLHSKLQLSFKKVVKMALDAARGMNYLHQCKPPVVHRDMKSLNLLVDQNFTVKVADFGLSKNFKNTLNSKMGTLNWIAPEILSGETSYSPPSDVFSFGMVMWEMVTRQTPFSGWNPLQIVRALDRGERLPIPGTCNESFGILITRCWSNEPTLRPLFEEIVTKLRELHLSLSEEEIH